MLFRQQGRPARTRDVPVNRQVKGAPNANEKPDDTNRSVMMNSVAHRRQYPRYAAVFSTKYTLKEGTFRDLVRNIGAGGAYISSRRAIRTGRRINVQIPVFAFGRKLSLMGEVIRSGDDGFAVMFSDDIDVRIFKDGRFPANGEPGTRSTIKIDKNCVV